MTYSGQTGVYAFGGNPIVPDDHYIPERNAFNNQRGDTLTSIYFSSIRNAVAARFQLQNNTENSVLINNEFQQRIDCAFYYELAGAWYNTAYNIALGNLTPTADEETISPRSGRWPPNTTRTAKASSIGMHWVRGASLSVPMVIDNTAPELVGSNPVIIDHASKTLTVTAKDNQYVAGVVLFNSSGTNDLVRVGAVQNIAPNTERNTPWISRTSTAPASCCRSMTMP